MPEYKTIEIDMEIYKMIEAKRESFSQTRNEILRKLLKLGPIQKTVERVRSKLGVNIGKGVFLPEGTILTKTYKGNEIEAVVEGQMIRVNGKGFASPSGAAVEITGTPVNGWRFWMVKRPDDNDFQLLANLRDG